MNDETVHQLCKQAVAQVMFTSYSYVYIFKYSQLGIIFFRLPKQIGCLQYGLQMYIYLWTSTLVYKCVSSQLRINRIKEKSHCQMDSDQLVMC